MGPFEGLSIFFDNKLIFIAKDLGYSESNIAILQNNEQELETHYPNVYQNILSCSHHRDARTPLQYAKDLVASWIFEDYILDIFRKNNISILLSGADKNREVLKSSETSSVSDYLLQSDGISIHVELMSNYTDFWIKTGKLHLRDEKYTQLKESNAVMICISPIFKFFFLIDFRKNIDAKLIPYHRPYGGKSAYELSINCFIRHPFDVATLCEEIKKIR